jgi:hypothetical protein
VAVWQSFVCRTFPDSTVSDSRLSVERFLTVLSVTVVYLSNVSWQYCQWQSFICRTFPDSTVSSNTLTKPKICPNINSSFWARSPSVGARQFLFIYTRTGGSRFRHGDSLSVVKQPERDGHLARSLRMSKVISLLPTSCLRDMLRVDLYLESYSHSVFWSVPKACTGGADKRHDQL